MEKRLSFDLAQLIRGSREYRLDLCTSRVVKSTIKVKHQHKEADGGSTSVPSGNELAFRVFEVSNEKRSANVKARRYEGGFTIWEATWFLVSFLHKEVDNEEGALAIDLGCGNGICGILLALKKGYKVLFQDLNWEVLEESVVPNCLLNGSLNRLSTKAGLSRPMVDATESHNVEPESDTAGQERQDGAVSDTDSPKSKKGKRNSEHVEVILKSSGNDKYRHAEVVRTNVAEFTFSQPPGTEKHDVPPPGGPEIGCKYELLSCVWDDMPSHAGTFMAKYCNACSLVVASECLYRPENYPAIANILLEYLSEKEGAAYIATKRLYFGMEGGSFEFITYINTKHRYASHKLQATIHRTQRLPGSSNVIDILQVKKSVVDNTQQRDE